GCDCGVVRHRALGGYRRARDPCGCSALDADVPGLAQSKPSFRRDSGVMRSKLPFAFCNYPFRRLRLLKPLLALRVYFEEAVLIAFGTDIAAARCQSKHGAPRSTFGQSGTWICALEKITGFSSFFDGRHETKP